MTHDVTNVTKLLDLKFTQIGYLLAHVDKKLGEAFKWADKN